jgi:hypothetical protein
MHAQGHHENVGVEGTGTPASSIKTTMQAANTLWRSLDA